MDKYCCPKTRQFVINAICEQQFNFDPAELVQLGITFKMEKSFKWGFRQLLGMSLIDIRTNHHSMMGNDIFIALVYAKAVLDNHCCLIAAEEPAIMVHADDCLSPRECADDWHAAWWNGMGRFLLDGRNLQPYFDAVK